MASIRPRPCWSDRRRRTQTIVMFLVFFAGTASASADGATAGRAIAETNCSRCHSVASSGESPLPAAPPFRTLHERYPIESLEEALAEGIFVGHSPMPEFKLSPQEVGELIVYLKSLDGRPR